MRTSRSTYELTASTQIRVGHIYLASIQVLTDGTNDATVAVYNVAASGDAAAGNKVYECVVAGANGYGGRNWTCPVKLSTGMYITVSGSGASFIAEWFK